MFYSRVAVGAGQKNDSGIIKNPAPSPLGSKGIKHNRGLNAFTLCIHIEQCYGSGSGKIRQK